MTSEYPIAISISRQLGSGGSVIGRKLAKQLNFLLLDREILHEAANRLGILVDELEAYEEKIKSIWKLFLFYCQYSDFEYTTPAIVPSDRKIYEVEADIISNAAKEKSVVIVGRGANYILRNHPNHLSIFLHANVEFRQKRVQEIFSIPENKAVSLIHETDSSRKEHIHKFTGQNMNDARNYNLSIDTGIIGLDTAEKIITDYIWSKFGDKIKN